MARKLAFIHTVASLVEPFNQLVKDFLPGDLEVFHVADEMLLKVVLAQGGLSPFIYRRVAQHATDLELAGADLIQLTCSSISPCADAAQPMVDVPILKIDTPMVDKAISIGRRIGISATAPTTLKPTTELVHARAHAAGTKVSVNSVLCEGAYAALFSGDVDTHDQIVRETLRNLMSESDVVILAQASMARVAETIPEEEQTVPIIASPQLAIEHAREVLASL
jgi:Asp/Glu/hydantoin racemase